MLSLLVAARSNRSNELERRLFHRVRDNGEFLLVFHALRYRERVVPVGDRCLLVDLTAGGYRQIRSCLGPFNAEKDVQFSSGNVLAGPDFPAPSIGDIVVDDGLAVARYEQGPRITKPRSSPEQLFPGGAVCRPCRRAPGHASLLCRL